LTTHAESVKFAQLLAQNWHCDCDFFIFNELFEFSNGSVPESFASFWKFEESRPDHLNTKQIYICVYKMLIKLVNFLILSNTIFCQNCFCGNFIKLTKPAFVKMLISFFKLTKNLHWLNLRMSFKCLFET